MPDSFSKNILEVDAGENSLYPITKIVNTESLVVLTERLSEGDEHAYVSRLMLIADERWLVTIQATSLAKWEEVRSWCPAS